MFGSIGHPEPPSEDSARGAGFDIRVIIIIIHWQKPTARKRRFCLWRNVCARARNEPAIPSIPKRTLRTKRRAT